MSSASHSKAAALSSEPDDDSYAEFAQRAQFITCVVLYPLVAIVGGIGCLFCLVTFSRRALRASSTNAYLAALACADLMKLTNDFLYFPASLMPQLGLFARLYPYAFFLSQYASGCAAWLTVAVAIERCLMVTQPNWSRYSLTVAKARAASLAIFVILLLITGPYLLRFQAVCEVPIVSADQTAPKSIDVANAVTSSEADVFSNNVTQSAHDYSFDLIGPPNITHSEASLGNCTWQPTLSNLWRMSPYADRYSRVHSFVRSQLPLAILICVNVRITMTLWTTRANKKLAARNRVTIMLAIVILCAILFTMPDSLLSVLGWGYAETTSQFRKGIREISDLMLSMNSAINFFLYISFNRIFLRCFIKTFCPFASASPASKAAAVAAVKGAAVKAVSSEDGGLACETFGISIPAVNALQRRERRLRLRRLRRQLLAGGIGASSEPSTGRVRNNGHKELADDRNAYAEKEFKNNSDAAPTELVVVFVHSDPSKDGAAVEVKSFNQSENL